ncbi:MAG: glutathione peroxidase [Alphaproteobacteria bacterium]|jgi:glutathione peroxidase
MDTPQTPDIANDAYGFTFKTLTDEAPLPLSDFQGKVLLVVNTASHCGFTPQLSELEALHQTYKDQGLVIMGVPSNDFGHQEPGTNEEIAYFCKVNYGVTFLMTSKIEIAGETGHPFYQWAKQVLGASAAPKWNFHKYLIDRQGHLIGYFYSATSPNSQAVKDLIEKALASN